MTDPRYPYAGRVGEYDHLPAYDGLRITLDGERKRKASLSGREAFEASKSPERRAAEARMRANKIARDREFEAREKQRVGISHLTGAEIAGQLTTEQKASLAAKLGVKAAPAMANSTRNAAPAKAATKPASSTYADGLGKGFAAGRDIERVRIREVAAVAIERGQAAEALRMLATDAEASTIVAKLKETNILVEAMKARFEGGAA